MDKSTPDSSLLIPPSPQAAAVVREQGDDGRWYDGYHTDLGCRGCDGDEDDDLCFGNLPECMGRTDGLSLVWRLSADQTTTPNSSLLTPPSPLEAAKRAAGDLVAMIEALPPKEAAEVVEALKCRIMEAMLRHAERTGEVAP